MAKPNLTPPNLTQQDIDRFWSNVDKSPGQGPNGDCWGWKAAKSNGYGQFHIREDGRQRCLRSHKVSLFLKTNYWGDLMTLHSCDYYPCCNPEHLRSGTHAENTLDMVSRNRQAKGERSGRYTKPERTARGERHGSRTKPERSPRGLRHGWHTKPESILRGEKAGTAKIDNATVLVIRERFIHTKNKSKIARDLKLSRTIVTRVLLGRTWSHI